jgi:hypothetical protein
MTRFQAAPHGAVLQSKYYTFDISLDSHGFSDESGHEEDPGKIFFQFLSNMGHHLAMTSQPRQATLRHLKNPQKLGYILLQPLKSSWFKPPPAWNR